jgi:hypothetical protein
MYCKLISRVSVGYIKLRIYNNKCYHKIFGKKLLLNIAAIGHICASVGSTFARNVEFRFAFFR